MPYPVNHKLRVDYKDVQTPSVATTPVAVYMRVPFRCKFAAASAVLGGAITGANAVITIQNVTQAVTIGTITIPFAGSAAGVAAVAVFPVAANQECNDNDIISFTPAGATGASIPAYIDAAMSAD